MISVLIPCFNEEKHIELCIRSVLAFDVPEGEEIEILVIDGCSTDRSRQIVDELGREDLRVSLLDNPKRIQSAAMNVGISSSRGEWIMRLDAHAQYPVDYLSECYRTSVLTKAENVGGICVTKPWNESYEASVVQAITTHKFGVGNSGFRTNATAGPSDTVPFGFFPRHVFDRYGMFDERLARGQDYEFNRRIKARGGTVFLNPAIKSIYFSVPGFADFLKKQFLRQGPFTAYMWYLAPYAVSPRHAITSFFTCFILVGLPMALLYEQALFAYLAIVSLYFLLAMFSGMQQSYRYKRWQHLFCLPTGFFLFHFIHGAGVLVGLFRLLNRSAPVMKTKSKTIDCRITH